MGDQNEVLSDIRKRLVRVETKLDNQNDLRKKADDTKTGATETVARSKSNTHDI